MSLAARISNRPATRADLLALPDEPGFEVIAGTLIERELARFEHGHAQRRLGAQVDPFDRQQGGGPRGGWWIASEVEVEYETQEVYRHDLAGWRRERSPERPTGRCIALTPDWVCEILSPTNWVNDTVSKFKTLERHQVPHYWLVDLEHGVLTVFRFGGRVYEVAALAQPGERARLEPFEALEMDVAVLFGEDPGDA